MTALEISLYLWGCSGFAIAYIVGRPVVVKCSAIIVNARESIISARTDLALPTSFSSSEFALNYD